MKLTTVIVVVVVVVVVVLVVVLVVVVVVVGEGIAELCCRVTNLPACASRHCDTAERRRNIQSCFGRFHYWCISFNFECGRVCWGASTHDSPLSTPLQHNQGRRRRDGRRPVEPGRQTLISAEQIELRIQSHGPICCVCVCGPVPLLLELSHIVRRRPRWGNAGGGGGGGGDQHVSLWVP